MSENQKPWHITPSQLFLHAIEHASKNTDFDIQMAYLILDISVETLFKAYLQNFKSREYRKLQQDAKKAGREINFFNLIEKIKEVAKSQIQEFPIDDCMYYHGIRNKLYHDGDGVMPTRGNLEAYLKLSKQLFKELLSINIDNLSANFQEIDPESKYKVQHETWKTARSTNDLALQLKSKMDCVQECSAILTERLRPNFATREFALKQEEIYQKYKYFETSFSDYEEAQIKINLANNRLQAFN